jgi:hypothetical protein
MTDSPLHAATPSSSAGVSRTRAALLLLPMALCFALAGGAFASRAALRFSPLYFQTMAERAPAPFSWLTPANAESMASTAFAVTAWKLALPLCASWLVVAAAGLLDRRLPALGWRGRDGRFRGVLGARRGLVWLTMAKTIRFAPRPELLPERYAFLDPDGVGGEVYRQAVAVHSGFEVVWAATLFGALGATAFAGFARRRPAARRAAPPARR